VRHGLSTQVSVGSEEGLKHDSAIHCDELLSLPKSVLTDYVGSLSESRLRELNRALAIALELV
jgi:mRNA interferase MazF